MAQTLLEQIQTGALAALHSLVNQALSGMSIDVLRQQVRSVEEGIDQLEGMLADQRGAMVSEDRVADRLEAQAAQTNEDLNDLLRGGVNPTSKTIVDMQIRYDAQTADAQRRRRLLEEAEVATAAVQTTYDALKARKAEMLAKIEELVHLEQVTRTREAALAAVKKANEIGSLAGGDARVDDFAQDVRQRADAVAAKLQDAVGQVTAEPAAQEARLLAELRIKERIARLQAADQDVAASSEGDHTTAASRLTA